MKFVEAQSTDPGWNLAMEEYLAGCIPKGEKCLFLWRNDNTIVVGKNQNTLGEINIDYVREHKIRVRRRLSGGGAVYHDLGNLCYTLIADAPESGGIDFSPFCAPVIETIRSFGVEAELSGRNDIMVSGRKISGNAQYYHNGKVIHHGTILFSSNLEVLSQALKVDRSKFQGKGVASVTGRVTNLQDHLPKGTTLMDFRQRLLECIRAETYLDTLELTPRDLEVIRQLQQRYDSWQWNYGYSPAFGRRESKRIPNCGTVEVYCEMDRGILQKIQIRGDFFGQKDIAELERMLEGCSGNQSAILDRLRGFPIQEYISGISCEMLSELIAPEGEREK